MSIHQLKLKSEREESAKAVRNSPGQGRKCLASLGDVRKMIKLVKQSPFITAKKVKETKFTPRYIRKVLQHAVYSAKHAAKKPMLNEKMMQQRMEFTTSHLHWTAAEWRKVSFTDESTFRLVRGGTSYVRRGPNSNRFEQRFCRKTVKHSASIMIWGMFDGRYGRGGIDFLKRTGKRKETMDTKRYQKTLENHFIRYHRARQSTHLLQDSAPCHTSKVTQKWLRDHGVEVIKWPGNSPDLNPIENLWSIFKGKLESKHCKNLTELREQIEKIWREDITLELCQTLANSMPARLQAVHNNNGGRTKY